MALALALFSLPEEFTMKVPSATPGTPFDEKVGLGVQGGWRDGWGQGDNMHGWVRGAGGEGALAGGL